MYKICATKKDLLEKTKLKIPFIYLDWALIVTDDFGEDMGRIGLTVLITLHTASESEGLQGYYDTDYGLVVYVTDRVYNGLIVQLLDPNTLTPVLQAELHNIRANRNITKEDVSNSTCSLSEPSAGYANNRLVREEDIIEPPTFNIYYDSRNIKLTVVQNTGYSAVYHSYDYESNNIAKRPVNKTLSDEEQKALALTYYAVHKGDLVIIDGYESDELIPVIDSIKDYTSSETIYSFSEESDPNKITRSFFATQECYVAYNLQDPNIHNIIGAIPEIDCSTGAGVAITLTGCEVDLENDMVRNDEVVLALTGSIFRSCFLPTSHSKACAVDTPLTIHVINGEISGITYSLNRLELVGLQSNITIDLLDGSHLSDLGENYYSLIMPGEDCQIEASFTVTKEDEEDPEEPNINILEPVYTNITLDETSDVSGVIIHGLPVNNGETIKIPYVSFKNEIPISWDNLFVLYTISRTTGYCSTKRIKFNNLLPQSYVLKLRNIEYCCKYLSLNGPEQALSVGKFWDGQEIKLVLSEGSNLASPLTLIQSVFVPYDITTGSNLFKNTQVVTATFNPLKQNFKFTEKSFSDIQSLTVIAMENTNAEVLVEALAFCNDTQLKLFPFDLTAELGIQSFENTGFSELLGPVRFTIIPYAAFANCKQLTSIDYGETDITNIHQSAFENCSKLSSCILPASLSDLSTFSFKNTGITGIDTYPKYTSVGMGSLIFRTNNRYENGMTVLHASCFEGCLLRQVYLPSSIKTILSHAFLDQNSILKFRAPGLLYVESGVFEGTWIERLYSSRLVSADIDLATNSGIDPMYKDQYGMIPNTEGVYFLYKPSNWDDGGIDPDYAFAVYLSPRVENDKLILYKIDLSLAKWDWRFWEGCRLQLHNNTISIADRAAAVFWSGIFSFRYAIRSLYCNDGLLVIGKGAFLHSLLRVVQFPNNGSLTDITTEAFSECTRLESVSNFEKQTKLKSIGAKTFYNCYELTSISVPSSITYVGDLAFSCCDPNLAIAGIIWNKLTYVGIEAFLSNKKISGKLDLSNASYIGSKAFEGCDGITEIFFSSILKSIPTAGFRYCSGLTSVNIGENVTHIGEAAFGKCYNLSSITFRGTKAQWNAITKEKDWKYNIKATVVRCTDGDLSL